MDVESFARVIELARIVYQVEVDDESPHLVDADHLRVDVCPPGVEGLADPGGPDGRSLPTPRTWRVTIGEENDGGLARGEGDTLTDAVADLARVVGARRAAMLAALAQVSP